MGSGPPSGAGTLGAAAATYVLTRAASRNIALIARFIGFSPCVRAVPGGAAFHAPALYSRSSSPLRIFTYFTPKALPKLCQQSSDCHLSLVIAICYALRTILPFAKQLSAQVAVLLYTNKSLQEFQQTPRSTIGLRAK